MSPISKIGVVADPRPRASKTNSWRAIPVRTATSCEMASCTGRLFPLAACSPPAWLVSSPNIVCLAKCFGHSYPPTQEESLAEFVRRKFGVEVLDYLVDPFISTIFFGDTQKMGMHSAFPALVEWEQSRGSVVRGAIRAYRAKRDGKIKIARRARVSKRLKFEACEICASPTLCHP